jgi:hypothetical protein
VIALGGGIRKPGRLAAWNVRNVQHLIQEQEAIIGHLHDALVVMQPGNALNGPVSVAAVIWAESGTLSHFAKKEVVYWFSWSWCIGFMICERCLIPLARCQSSYAVMLDSVRSDVVRFRERKWMLIFDLHELKLRERTNIFERSSEDQTSSKIVLEESGLS